MQVGDTSELSKGEKREREKDKRRYWTYRGLQGDVKGVLLHTAFLSVTGKARKQERVVCDF